MKIILALLLCFTFVANSFGSVRLFRASKEIAGTVTDKFNKFVIGVKVTLVNVKTKKRLQTKTDNSGFFKFTNIALGSYRLEFTGKSEYLPLTSDLFEVGLNGSIGHNITLISK